MEKIKAKASATGKDIQKPNKPNNEGSTIKHGIKNSNCREEEMIVAGKPLPIAWKKNPGINWIPRVKKIIEYIRMAATPSFKK